MLDPQADQISPYAWSKISDEVAAGWARARNLDVLIARFTNVYGPGASLDEDSSTVVHALVRRALELEPGQALRVWGDGTAVRSFAHVEDAAAGIVTMLDAAAPGVTCNISTTGPVTIAELAATIRDLAAPEAELAFDPSAPGGPSDRPLDDTTLRSLGLVARYDLRSGLETVVSDARKRLVR